MGTPEVETKQPEWSHYAFARCRAGRHEESSRVPALSVRRLASREHPLETIELSLQPWSWSSRAPSVAKTP